MVPNLRHLYVFLEVARRKSVSATSQYVHLTQPAVTQAIAGLERFFEAPLFNRSNTGMDLTEAGRLCAIRIERAIGQVRDGLAELTGPMHTGLERLITSAQLRALAAVAEQGGFALAARNLGVAKPTLHRAARDLERLLEVPLFEKTSFGVRPTRDTERLARRARLAFAEVAQARAEVSALRGQGSGSTVIGAMPLARSFLVPKALIDFMAACPDHHVSILEAPYESLLNGLRMGAVDFLVGALRDPSLIPDVVQEHLFDDPLAIIVRAGHPLAQRKTVSVAALARFAWIAPRAGSPLRQQFERLFKSAKIALPAHPIDCNSQSAARALLLGSDRIMLLSAHQMHYEIAAGLLTALPHPGGKVVRSIGLTLRRDWQPTRSQERLLQMLRQHACMLARRFHAAGVHANANAPIPRG